MSCVLRYECLIPSRSINGSQTVPWESLVHEVRQHFSECMPGGPVAHFFGEKYASGAKWRLTVMESEDDFLSFTVETQEPIWSPRASIVFGLTATTSCGPKNTMWVMCLVGGE